MKTNILSKIMSLLTLMGLSSNGVVAQQDVFGITQFYPSKSGMREWTSEHWNNGTARTVKYASDPYDPTDWTEDHSGTTPGFFIDGKGTMTMSGTPRFHINPLRSSKVAAQLFTNIEFTAYYQRKGLNGANYGGMVVGMRGSALGHGSSGGNVCEAQCYQARFRDDGKWDFEKELKHPGSTYYSGSGYNKQDPLWGGKKLPTNRWIGMKYIMLNVKNNTNVRLRVYIDSVSNGKPVDGGVWQLVGDITDDGTNWPGADISGCSYTNPYMPILAGGNVYMRTDNDTAVYKMVTIREIDPTVTGWEDASTETEKAGIQLSTDQSTLKVGEKAIVGYELSNVKGQTMPIRKLDAHTLDISTLPFGTYVVRITTADGMLRKKFVLRR